MVMRVSPSSKLSPSTCKRSIRAGCSHAATDSSASLRLSPSWLPELTASEVFCRSNPKYFSTNRDLHIRIERRGEVEEITADHGEVVLAGVGQQSIELLERIVQIGNEEKAHNDACAAQSASGQENHENKIPECKE
jgi:hypothetical protein